MTEYNELFELCKEVYEATGWDSEDLPHYQERIGGDGQTMLDVIYHEQGVCPLYTSDYLLEKLQTPLVIEDHKNQRDREHLGYDLYHVVAYPDKPGLDFLTADSNTPLKALLKLTIELKKKGLL